MAHPDHDAAVGRLAAARLRAVEPRPDAHPDAEAWAAYADGGLLPEDVAQLESHLAACTACRQLVAALTLDLEAGAGASDGSEAAEAPRRGVVLPFRPRATWAWMSLAAALLAAATLWSVVRLDRFDAVPMTQVAPPPVTSPGASTVPADEQAARPGAAAGAAPAGATASADAPTRMTAPAPAEADRDAALAKLERAQRSTVPATQAKEAQPGLDAFTAPKPEAPPLADAVRANEPVPQPAPVTAPPPARAPAPVSEVRGPAVNTPQQNMQQALNAQANAQQEMAKRAEAQREREGAAPAQAAGAAARVAAPPAPAAPTPPPTRPQPPAAAPDAPVGQVSETVSTTGDTASGRRQGFEEAKDKGDRKTRDDAPAFGYIASRPAIVFAEPGGRLRWRIEAGRRLESSSDGGTTWTPRYTAAARLRAGAAPAIDAAWAVGEGGLVLRLTVPGGWAAVARPASVTLVAVSASSADIARVTAEDGRVFDTADGGRSWTPVAAGAQPR